MVDLANEDESAVSTIPAIVTLSNTGPQPKTYTVPAGDAGGETIRFRLSTAAESCAGCGDPHPPGLTIDPNTGVVTWDTTGRSGLWWTGVVIESLVGGVVRATTHIQYIVSVGGTTANESPEWDSPPTPADGTVFTIAPGQNLQFNLQATDPDAGDTVTITQNSGPGSLTTSTPGNPGTATFSYTPTAADEGNDYIVQFIATDQDGAGPPFRSYTIKVRTSTSPGGVAAKPAVVAGAAFKLRNTLTTGTPDTTFNFGNSREWPIMGDWNGDGTATPGRVNLGTRTFSLRNSNTAGPADIVFTFQGASGIPVVGDWDGDGDDGVGFVGSPPNNLWSLRNDLTTGPAQVTFNYGNGWPIAGDWDGDGDDTPGDWHGASGTWRLRNTNSTGAADMTFVYRPLSTSRLHGFPVAGDWDGDGDDTVGQTLERQWAVRNTNTAGPPDISFSYNTQVGGAASTIAWH